MKLIATAVVAMVLLTGCAQPGGYDSYAPRPMLMQMPVQQYQQTQRPAVTTDCTVNGNQVTCKERPHYNILQGGCNPNFPASCVQ
jgi:hypothetical protein